MRNQQIRTMEELRGINRLRQILEERERDREFNLFLKIMAAGFISMIVAVMWFTASCIWRF